MPAAPLRSVVPAAPLRSAVLGIVQGIAEVVPVSSSAQLVLVPALLGWPPAADRTRSAALLHAGSCAGIAFAMRRDLADLSRSELALLAAGSLPAALAGLVGADAVERRLGRPPQLAALLAAAGALMWAVETRSVVRVRQVGPAQATAAALAQPLALVPGVSRSGATRTALRAVGVAPAQAQRFSLLMSLPVTAGAAALTLGRAARRGSDWRGALAESAPGMLTAAVASGLAVRGVERRVGAALRLACLYRLAVAAAVAARWSRRAW